MIGNDLVDLEQAAIESNWQRKGYLAKIYTASEQQMINESVNPDHMVWLLWSMKEAAYKIHSRKTGIRKYAPLSIACSTINFNQTDMSGLVSIEGEYFYTQSVFKDAYVHTIAAGSTHILPQIRIAIYKHPENLFDYRSTKPKCVSHHGKYLALVY